MHSAILETQEVDAMFPLWQVSYDIQISNGSSVPNDMSWHPTWWKDCHISVQYQCELQLQNTRSKFWMEYNQTDYIMDLVQMTQLNTRTGTLRKMRRLLIHQLSIVPADYSIQVYQDA